MRFHPHRIKYSILFVTAISLILMCGMAVSAQVPTDPDKAMMIVKDLVDAQKLGEAAPYLAVVVKAHPDDPDAHALYGLSLLFASKQTDDVEKAKSMAALALTEFQTSKKLGSSEVDVDTFIAILSGSDGAGNSTEGGGTDFDHAEILFAQSKYDEAFVFYKKALDADPKNYKAALYAADSLMSLQKYDEAEKYYQRAISIDPKRETAYRYSATPLMKQGRLDEARERYINAIIAEPYNQISYLGLNQWAKAANATISHPKIAFPDDDKPVDPTSPWSDYLTAKNDFCIKQFGVEFPTEETYRHSLKEEATAIRAAIRSAGAKISANADLSILKKIDDEGMLEAYILLSKPDEGISHDYDAYRDANAAKLRQYISAYMIKRS